MSRSNISRVPDKHVRLESQEAPSAYGRKLITDNHILWMSSKKIDRYMLTSARCYIIVVSDIMLITADVVYCRPEDINIIHVE